MMKLSTLEKNYDYSTILGISLAITLMLIAIVIGGGTFKGFVDSRALLIVIGGTIFITVACFSFKEFFEISSIFTDILFVETLSPQEAATKAIDLAKLFREKGVTAITAISNKYDNNDIFKQGLSLIIDNIEEKEISTLLESEINANHGKALRMSEMLKKAAEVAPAMGLIGTLIGLLQMLSNLKDIATIGPSMAVALLTTFYGATLSYMVLLPLSSKIDGNAEKELLVSRIYMEGFLSISKKENPRKLETKLNSLLSSTGRITYFNN